MLDMRRHLLILSLYILIIAGMFFILQKTGVLEIYRVIAPGMMPAYRPGSLIFASSCKKPACGNAISYHPSSRQGSGSDSHACISRLIGFEGDTIEMNDGYLLRN